MKRSKWNLLVTVNNILLSITIYHIQPIHPVYSLKSHIVPRLQPPFSTTSLRGMQSSDITTSNTDITTGESNINMNRINDDDDDNDKNCTRLRIGFIGCGTIASAIVTGFAKQQQQQLSNNNNNLEDKTKRMIQIDQIVVTRRSESKSLKLQLLYPDLVTICNTNQNVLDECDIIFITVLPDQTTNVLQELHFNQRKRHILISLVSTSQLESLCYDSKLPQSSVYKMICLPAVAYNDGVCLLQIPSSSTTTTTNSNNNDQENEAVNTNTTTNNNTPSTILLLDLLGLLGNVVIAKNDNEMSALMVPSGLMGLLYGILRNNRDWIKQHTSLSNHDASNLIIRYYSNMIQDAVRTMEHHDEGHNETMSNDDVEHHGSVLDELIQEQTIGGLNEQGLANGELLNVLDSYNQIQDAMLLRILGQSDGSINR